MQVKAYKNLHRNCFSLVATEGPDRGRVVAHASEVLLMDCTFVVSEAGRQRVIREGRKNVHAFVVGSLAAAVGLEAYKGRACPPVIATYSASMWDATRNLSSPFTYSPFRAGWFADVAGRAMISAREVILSVYHAPVAHGGMRALREACVMP